MSEIMTVLYIEHTGHVVAAIAQPAAAPPKEALIGIAFPLRSTRRRGIPNVDARFALPPAILAVKSIPLDPRVLSRPQSFVVNGDSAAELPKVDFIATNVVSQTMITITYGAGVAASVKALAIVRTTTGSEHRIQSGTLPPGNILAMQLRATPDGPAAGLTIGTACEVAVASEGQPIRYEALNVAP